VGGWVDFELQVDVVKWDDINIVMFTCEKLEIHLEKGL